MPSSRPVEMTSRRGGSGPAKRFATSTPRMSAPSTRPPMTLTPSHLRLNTVNLRLAFRGTQVHAKRGAPRRIVLREQPTAVDFDDRPADGQAHAEALGLGREERLEDPVQVGFRDAVAAIAHAELDVRCGDDGGPHRDGPRRR